MSALGNIARGKISTSINDGAPAIPSFFIAAPGALAKTKRIRGRSTTQKLVAIAIGDSNAVPIDNVSSNSKQHGLHAATERALTRMRQYATKEPQTVQVLAGRAGGGTKSLDDYSDFSSPNCLWRGPWIQATNIGGSIPMVGLGGGVFLPDGTGTGAGRKGYLLLDPTINPELKDKTKIRVCFGAAAATDDGSGNNPRVNTTNSITIGGTAFAGPNFIPQFSNFTFEWINLTGVADLLTFNGATTTWDIISATGSTNTVVNNDIGAYYGGFWSADLTIPANTRGAIRIQSTGNCAIERVVMHDGASAGIGVLECCMSGLSDALTRLNSRAYADGSIDQTNPVLIDLLHRCIGQASWAGIDKNQCTTQANAFTAANNPWGVNIIIDADWMNSVNDAATNTNARSPGQVAGMLYDQCNLVDARTTTQECIVIKIIPPCPFGSLATSNATRNILYTGAGPNYHHNDYRDACYAVQAQFPNTCIIIDLQKAWGDLLPMDLKALIGHSGVYPADSNLNLDNLHMKFFAFIGRAAEEIERLFNIYCD